MPSPGVAVKRKRPEILPADGGQDDAEEKSGE